MFQFPRFPPGLFRVASHHACRVAPFGDLGIAGCQRLPRAFRRVATSFIGVQRQGIHRVPIIPVAPYLMPPTPARLVPRRDSSQAATLVASTRVMMCLCVLVRQDLPTRTSCSPITRPVGPRRADFHRPIALSRCQTAGGAAGVRTPNLRRARAALSRLSYDPQNGPVGAPGLEPGTSALSGPRSNQLSYAPAAPLSAVLVATPPTRRPKMEDTQSLPQRPPCGGCWKQVRGIRRAKGAHF